MKERNEMVFTEAKPSNLIPVANANPTKLFEALNRYQHTMALKGAIDLELFTYIAGGAVTSAAIAGKCHASERGIRILCDFLTVMGFLTKENGQYGLTHDAAILLDKGSPLYMGGISNFLTSKCVLGSFEDLAAVVRHGRPLDKADVTEPEKRSWVEFAHSMKPIANMSARLMAPIVSQPGRPIKVLDVAAGHGIFGIAVALSNPAAEIYAVDWNNVLEVAKQNAAAAGIQDRFHPIPGSIFEVDLSAGYDLILLPNFLHHFGPQEIVGLLKRLRAALSPSGIVATLEFVPNEDRVTPPIAAAFSLIMLAKTPNGDAYTFEELDRMFRNAGFGESRIQPLYPSPQHLLLTRTEEKL
jgi:2-polyprenyl-3-methyl-5-hydroxy-6-metoxy-1,4-benzoquinol methylase